MNDREVFLFGASELIEGQFGYSTHGKTGEPLDWPGNLVVIASEWGNPYCLDLARSDGCNAPIVTARHGTGSWNFEDDDLSFLGFLESLVRRLE